MRIGTAPQWSPLTAAAPADISSTLSSANEDLALAVTDLVPETHTSLN